VIKHVWFRIVLLLFVALLAVGPAVLTTRAGNISLDGAHWARGDTPFSLRIGDSVSGRWDGHLKQAATDWRRSGVVRMRVVPSGTDNLTTCPARNGMVEVCSARYGRNNWLGLARIWVDGNNHIVRASILMNDTYFGDPYYNKPRAMRHTMCHELGHVIGLDHNGGRSCLNDSDTAVFRDARPSQVDFNRLRRLYNHRDSESTIRGAARPGRAFDAAAAPPLPDGDSPGTSETVRVESRGDGGRLITSIYWVDGDERKRK
jgi:hypothetical protein